MKNRTLFLSGCINHPVEGGSARPNLAVISPIIQGIKKGTLIKRFVKWFLQNDPVWSSKVDKIWLNNEKDLGDDLIFMIEKVRDGRCNQNAIRHKLISRRN
tara:strand:+ start:203 stop:505 length:303 start_codon:yes stop_codon:yes gene_type:complete